MGDKTPRVGSFARWLAATVRTRRIARGKLAQALDVSGASLSRWITGVELPSEARALQIIDHVVLPPVDDATDPRDALAEWKTTMRDAAVEWEAYSRERAAGEQAWREDRAARRLARSPEAATLAAHLLQLHAETRKAMRQLTVLDGLIARLAADFGGEVDDALSDPWPARGEVDEVVVHDFVELVRAIALRQHAGQSDVAIAGDPPIYIEIKRSAAPTRAGRDEA